MKDLFWNWLAPGRERGAAMAGAGMLGLCTGSKAVALGLFGKGVAEIEKAWRQAHPGFSGTLGERWREAVTFYEATHRHPTNRVLHMVGIPLILGGAVGLLAWPRFTAPWWVSNGAFVAGWAMNLVGHAVFEKNRPAFADDPLSFLAGPVWDLQQWAGMLRNQKSPRTA